MPEAILILIILVVDQLSKILTAQFLPLGASYPLWDGVFELTNVHNTGAAWGMFAGGRWFFIATTVVVCVLFAYVLLKRRGALGRLARVCLSLLLAGALGNLIDRVFLGYVRDMLNVSLINFPVFNVADSAVSIGAVLLAIDVLFGGAGSLFSVLEKTGAAKRSAPEEAAEKESDHAGPDEN